MKKLSCLLALVLAISVLFTACNETSKETKSKEKTKAQASKKAEKKSENSKEEKKPVEKIDYNKVKPNEVGKVMVVMFHNFVEKFESKNGDNGEYTTTFDDFEKLLPELYKKGYRLINLNDFLKNEIDVPAGCIPMIFTFDDGTAGQFNLVEKNKKLTVNPKSAVAIMEKFNKQNPDFGLKGTFYVNLGDDTFDGDGTVAERLKYLDDKGFELGNHTMTHINLKQTTSAEQIIKEVGGNQKKMSKLIPNYKFKTLSLPFGAPSENLRDNVVKGEFEGTKYENLALMEVGWDPSVCVVSKNFNPLSIHRVRASGIKPVQADLAWWLDGNIPKELQYVSDGDPNKVSVPQDKKDVVDEKRLQGKKLVVY